MKPMLTLGIMSGTSMDGADYALCLMDDRNVRLLDLWHEAFPPELRRRIQEAASGEATSWDTARLHHDLGRFYAAGARRRRSRSRPSLVGLHGQTIFHHPDRARAATFQIGEPIYLAQALGAPVVSNFRTADLAAGGQGAPLATAFHVRVFGTRRRHICIQNLGGISNVTSIDWRSGRTPSIRAFDTGPANVLIDLTVQHFSRGKHLYDRRGAWAKRGRRCDALVERWLQHPFILQPPPKSTGRELFGEPFLSRVIFEARRRQLSRYDLVATLTAFTARSIALNYRLHLPSAPSTVVLSGGGAENPILCTAIADALGQEGLKQETLRSIDVGWPANSIEPAAFAWLAWLRWHRQPGNFPETTGADSAVLSGQITDWTTGKSMRMRRYPFLCRSPAR